jgi:hypothetical protein
MSAVTEVREAAAPSEAGRSEPWWRRRPRLVDLAVLCGYTMMALYVTERMWRHLSRYHLTGNPTDQIQFQYFLEHAARIFTHGQYPFFTHQLNAPDGVNLMANTATLGLHIPLVPVTLLFGPAVSFAVMVTFSLAGTAAAWYWLFSRHVFGSRLAAFLAGGFCGFAPGMVSQANGHPNIATQALLPLILWWGIRLREPGRTIRNGLVLGVLCAYQVFINEEILFVAAVAAALFVGVWALHHRAEAREALPRFARGFGVAMTVAAVLLAYPLYVQFFGPQAYHGLPRVIDYYGTDLRAFIEFSRESFAGYPGPAKAVSQNPSEENAFFGWPLLVLSAVLAVVFRRSVVARAAVVTGVVMALLSLGPQLVYRQNPVGVPGPYWPLNHLPLFDSVVTGRLVLVLIPVIALLLGLWVDRVMCDLRGTREEVFRGRLVALGLVVAALLPVAPTPLPIVFRTPTPAFFTSGEWRSYVPAGRSVVTVPLTSLEKAMDGMQWADDVHIDFAQAGGYFLGPDPSTPDRRARFGPPPRPTAELWRTVALTGDVPGVGAAQRANALADLRYWKAAIVVLGDRPHQDRLAMVTTRLLGFPPRRIGGLLVWDVRPLVGP